MRIRPPRRRRPVAWVAVAVILSGAAAASGSGAAVPRAGLAAGVDHACVAPGSHAPAIAWSTLHNPVLSYPGAGVKDQALVWFAGRWHMIFSYVTGASTAPGHEHWDIATATSPDLAHWSGPRPWSEQPGGSASPTSSAAPTAASW